MSDGPRAIVAAHGDLAEGLVSAISRVAGAAAAGKLKDDIPKQEKERRHKILLETQKRISKELKVKK